MEKLDEVVGKLKSLRTLPVPKEGGAQQQLTTIKDMIFVERNREPDHQTVFLFLAVSSFVLSSVVSLQMSRAARRERRKRLAAAPRDEQAVSRVAREPGTIAEEPGDVFHVCVAPPDRFKFNAAHFIAYKGFRERLHGHNYTVTVDLYGRHKTGPDGYLVDFGDVKDVTIALCKELNERFLLPAHSDALEINVTEDKCEITCEDGAEFLFPKSDIAILPIIHSSAEELARYLWFRTVETFGREALLRRGVVTLQIGVAEMPTQKATFRRSILSPDASQKQKSSRQLYADVDYQSEDDDEDVPAPPVGGCCSLAHDDVA